MFQSLKDACSGFLIPRENSDRLDDLRASPEEVRVPEMTPMVSFGVENQEHAPLILSASTTVLEQLVPNSVGELATPPIPPLRSMQPNAAIMVPGRIDPPIPPPVSMPEAAISAPAGVIDAPTNALLSMLPGAAIMANTEVLVVPVTVNAESTSVFTVIEADAAPYEENRQEEVLEGKYNNDSSWPDSFYEDTLDAHNDVRNQENQQEEDIEQVIIHKRPRTSVGTNSDTPSAEELYNQQLAAREAVYRAHADRRRANGEVDVVPVLERAPTQAERHRSAQPNNSSSRYPVSIAPTVPRADGRAPIVRAGSRSSSSSSAGSVRSSGSNNSVNITRRIEQKRWHRKTKWITDIMSQIPFDANITTEELYDPLYSVPTSPTKGGYEHTIVRPNKAIKAALVKELESFRDSAVKIEELLNSVGRSNYAKRLYFNRLEIVVKQAQEQKIEVAAEKRNRMKRKLAHTETLAASQRMDLLDTQAIESTDEYDSDSNNGRMVDDPDSDHDSVDPSGESNPCQSEHEEDDDYLEQEMEDERNDSNRE
jgi:hypothetical protein